MFYPFNVVKAIQAAAALVRDQDRLQMERIRLLKLLYIAEREAVAETGAPIIGSRVVALKNGPLHSRLYDLIKGEDVEAVQWNQFFRNDGVEVESVADPGVGALSRFELRKLKEIHERYRNVETWDLVEETHRFPEWINNYPDREQNTSHTIPFRDIVNAVGRGDDFHGILDDLQEARAMDQLFSVPAADYHGRGRYLPSRVR